jgi:hypothetical protein
MEELKTIENNDWEILRSITILIIGLIMGWVAGRRKSGTSKDHLRPSA